jgi:hypothetical protein
VDPFPTEGSGEVGTQSLLAERKVEPHFFQTRCQEKLAQRFELRALRSPSYIAVSCMRAALNVAAKIDSLGASAYRRDFNCLDSVSHGTG